MAKKSSGVSKASNGGRQAQNLAHEAARQARFAKKRGTDRQYKWTPNPYDPEKEPQKYLEEQSRRAEKNKSHKTEYAANTSLFAKLN